jgi:glycosyltransferase involved in cell wall biosynthesis
MLPRLKVLFLTHHMPWPTVSGGRRREAELLHILAPRHEIEIVAITKVPQLDRQGLVPALRYGMKAAIFPCVPARKLLASSLVRQHWAPDAASYLARRLSRDDGTIVHVEGHFLMPLLPQRTWARALLVEHNVESALVRQHAALARGVPLALRTDSMLTARTEVDAWRKVAILGALSNHDAAVIRRRLPATEIRVLPTGSDHLLSGNLPDTARAVAPDLLFVANFSYWPNDLAARILVEDVFPRIQRLVPGTSLVIAGIPPPWLTAAAARDTCLGVPGWVDDLGGWLRAAKVIVCPLWVGGGIKIKVLEAAAAGQCVVTTSIGAQGLPPAVKDALVIRDDVASFAAAVATLLASERERLECRSRMRAAAAILPTWEQSAWSLEQCWAELSARQS